MASRTWVSIASSQVRRSTPRLCRPPWGRPALSDENTNLRDSLLLSLARRVQPPLTDPLGHRPERSPRTSATSSLLAKVATSPSSPTANGSHGQLADSSIPIGRDLAVVLGRVGERSRVVRVLERPAPGRIRVATGGSDTGRCTGAAVRWDPAPRLRVAPFALWGRRPYSLVHVIAAPCGDGWDQATLHQRPGRSVLRPSALA